MLRAKIQETIPSCSYPLLLTVKNPLFHAQEEVSYHLGNVIRMGSRDRVYATAYSWHQPE